jgi:hypothetical protein
MRRKRATRLPQQKAFGIDERKVNKAGGTKQTVLQPPTLTDKTIGACRHDACRLRSFCVHRRWRISPSLTTAGLKKPKKRGGNMEKDCGGRPRFVSFFLFQFAFCPFMQYLCNGKRSTQVLLFLCPESPHSSQGDFPPYFAGCHPARVAVWQKKFRDPQSTDPQPPKGGFTIQLFAGM